MDLPTIAVNFDLSGLEQFTRSMRYTDDAWNSELARDDRAVRQHSAALDHEPGDEEEDRAPPGIRLLRDENVSRPESRR